MYNEIRGINIKKLISKMFLGWKIYILVGVMMSLLFGGYKYFSDKRSNKTIEQYKNEITIEQANFLNTIIDEYNMLDYYETYYDNSYLTKLNPNSYQVLRIQYYVDTEYTFSLNEEVGVDYTPAVVSAYSSFIASEQFAEAIKKELNIDKDTAYIMELITTVLTQGVNVIGVEMIIPEGISSDDIGNVVDKIVNKHTESLNDIGEHSLRKIDSELFTTYSESIMKKIYALNSAISTTRTNIEAYKTELDNYQMLYLHEELSQDKYKEEFATGYQIATTATVNVKYVIIGFIFGIAGVAGVYVCKMIFSSKMQNDEDIETLFGVKTLGKVINDKVNKNILVSKIMYKGLDVMSEEKQIEYLAGVIFNLCRNKEIKELSFVTSNIGDIGKRIITEIANKLETLNIKVYVAGNIIQEKDELNNVLDIDNSIIVGNIERSFYSVIDKEIKILELHNSKILGSIVIE